MTCTLTDLPGLMLLEYDSFGDDRGSFQELYRETRYQELGVTARFVQDNLSWSHHGVLRGLHSQGPNPQDKLVSALVGSIWDVAVDVRLGSPTYGQWRAFELSEENRRQLLVPAGFLHGFQVLSERAAVYYKVSTIHEAAGDFSVCWNDPELAIEWPIAEPILSAKDRNAPFLAQVQDRLVPFTVS